MAGQQSPKPCLTYITSGSSKYDLVAENSSQNETFETRRYGAVVNWFIESNMYLPRKRDLCPLGDLLHAFRDFVAHTTSNCVLRRSCQLDAAHRHLVDYMTMCDIKYVQKPWHCDNLQFMPLQAFFIPSLIPPVPPTSSLQHILVNQMFPRYSPTPCITCDLKTGVSMQEHVLMSSEFHELEHRSGHSKRPLTLPVQNHAWHQSIRNR